ncbi:hypothetical protein GCM10010919_28930 [Alishewanella longhuensis]|uniref:DUF349 domain-containing protein n=1 Tax=Alishewanella longhuensis TaxID=1091037 RepID=A0ABQ3L3I3_9ALTE|nr:DUF349 domain-containing protein [Alishewanella longhuensis]GHG75017.1 hypothetical protein GCM10010919_28930 [Alishewanella longhuensis]
MIFKRWFKPKWQHADAAIRLQAIQTLQATDSDHKNILHELAFNDGAEAVRKAALHQLSDFALWWQASKHDAAERLRLYAEQQLISQLLDGEVESALKQKFVAQCNRSSVLEQLALKDSDPQLRYTLLQRLEKSDLIQQSLLDATFPDSYKRQLLEQITDEKQLEKLSKVLSTELATELNDRLAALAEQKQKPVKLRKELTLLLAKLNALRERNQIEDIPALQQGLATQWQQLATEMACLPKDEADSINAKYQQLTERLDSWIAPKLAELVKVQAAAEQQRQQLANYQRLQQAIVALEQQLAAQTQQGGAGHAVLDQALVALTEEWRVTALSAEQQRKLQTALLQLQQQCQQLPQIAATLLALKQLAADFSTQEVPQTPEQLTEAEHQLREFIQAWRVQAKLLVIAMPAELNTQFQQLKQAWQAAIESLKQQQQKGVKQLRSKCAEFKRLHAAGRYRVLFGLYKGIGDDYQQLSVVAQSQLEKEYAEVTALHAELESLQHYIATPRKQALLAEMQQLATAEVTDAKARAEQVKLARANWNSLGRAEPAQDEELNQAFDRACEAAFEPCRQIFAKLDAERALHLQQRQQLLAELTVLLDTELEVKALDQAYRQLSQRWREAGAVNRRDYQALQQQYQQLSNTVRERVNAGQQEQEAAKLALIEEARAALAFADGAQTASVLKELQLRWKALGFAGRKQDQALWLEFRALCDTFFAKRNEEYKAQQQAEQQAWQQTNDSLVQLAVQVNQADTLSAVAALQGQLRQLNVPDSAAARQQYQQVVQQLEQRLQSIQQQQQRTDLQVLFSALATGELKAEQWPAAYREALAISTPALSRPELTLALELISGKDSGQSSSAEKQQVQLALLSLKHNAGQQLTLEQLLQQWLAHGAVAEQEQPLLKRVAALF